MSGRKNRTHRRGGHHQRSSLSGLASSPQYSLVTLVEELAQRAEAGESQEKLIEWLYALTSRLGIRMRYDEHEAVFEPSPPPSNKKAAELTTLDEDLPAQVSSGASADDGGFQKGRRKNKEKVYVPITVEKGRMTVHFDDPALQERKPPTGGRFGHLAGGETFVGRVILSCGRGSLDASASLCAECNGAVIDVRTWALLVVPSRAFTPRPSAKKVDRALGTPDDSPEGALSGTGLYDIIQVSDGTVVSLYCWDHPSKGPIWCLSSCKGYDVSHLKWMGAKTYSEIVYELLMGYPAFVDTTGLTLVHDYLCKGDMRLAFANLDRSRSYTIGFRYKDFHPMSADPAGIWNIQAAVLATGTPVYDLGLPHIPRQALYSFDDIVRLAKAGGRAIGTSIQKADLDHISRTALVDAKAVIAGKGGSINPLLPAELRNEGIHVCFFNYGFILRSRKPRVTGAYSDILCESPLLRRVRQLIYRRPSRQVRVELDESSRLEFSALKAFLTAPDRGDFLALFPDFAPRFAIYQNFVDSVIHLVLHMHRQNAMAPSSRSSMDSCPKTQTKTVARALLSHILRREKDFKAFHPDARSIVHDFVLCPEYTVLYLRAIGLPAADQ
ncbi:BA71V-M448R [Elysia marginata]|uniref:BA71V-M448R n=1 Tax=Elysia marginata TaxID=1093978 RepID=A0AAV4GTY2_9GAST|nr:BA71V-M448R [Elysia marginata]